MCNPCLKALLVVGLLTALVVGGIFATSARAEPAVCEVTSEQSLDATALEMNNKGQKVTINVLETKAELRAVRAIFEKNGGVLGVDVVKVKFYTVAEEFVLVVELDANGCVGVYAQIPLDGYVKFKALLDKEMKGLGV